MTNSEHNNTPFQVDVEGILRSKTSRRVPRFLINFLKRIIHQEKINHFLQNEGSKPGYPFFDAVTKLCRITSSMKGLEKIDKNGRYIFVGNHPLGALEAMIIGRDFGAYFGEENINFVTNDILAHLKPLADYFTPVNVVSSKQERSALDRLDELFSSEKQIFIFPAGACSRRIKGTIQDYPWKKMFVAKARQYKRDVVPVFTTGRNSDFFYRLSNIRNRIGLKFNIELLYLPDEMFKQEGNHFDVYVGEPIAWQHFDRSRPDNEWAQTVRAQVYAFGAEQLKLAAAEQG